ncbi:Phosphate regulon transcriptional regulatory protein PhoB (SphR) [hydrothermal vent metagenome]|uniref:Phosphate regulon transcriptional regulatory protein PhoB (SphR) n=1 Tax=hydrothermal vent metagenome TaxID=652676 RepID=A0A3B0ZHI8_9ZZZZ
MSHKVLIIEDNAEIANLVQLHLRDIHCDADIAADGAHGLACFDQNSYQLVILDLMLPIIDGLEVCKRLRAHAHYVPIIMLTSKSSELDRVLGLEMGADDYIVKPFSLPELVARVKAQFRRMEAMKVSDTKVGLQPLQFADLVIDTDKHRVLLADNKIVLTAKEFDLLLHFASHPGRVYSRAELLDKVWNYRYEGYEHTVNSHINRLRNKIEADPANPRYILTVWGVGYKFSDELS